MKQYICRLEWHYVRRRPPNDSPSFGRPISVHTPYLPCPSSLSTAVINDHHLKRSHIRSVPKPVNSPPPHFHTHQHQHAAPRSAHHDRICFSSHCLSCTRPPFPNTSSKLLHLCSALYTSVVFFFFHISPSNPFSNYPTIHSTTSSIGQVQRSQLQQPVPTGTSFVPTDSK